MNIPPNVAANLSLWEYEALLWHWNDANGGDDSVEPPDPHVTQRLIDRINADPLLTSAPALQAA